MAALKYAWTVCRDPFGAYVTLIACGDQRSEIRDLAANSLRSGEIGNWLGNGGEQFAGLMQTIFRYNPELYDAAEKSSRMDEADWPPASPSRRLMQQKESWLSMLQFCRRYLFHSAGLLAEQQPQQQQDINASGELEDFEDEERRQRFQQWLRDSWGDDEKSQALQSYVSLMRYSMQNQTASDAKIQSAASVGLTELLLHSPGSILASFSQHSEWLKVSLRIFG
jgi:hypothetical protein